MLEEWESKSKSGKNLVKIYIKHFLHLLLKIILKTFFEAFFWKKNKEPILNIINTKNEAFTISLFQLGPNSEKANIHICVNKNKT